MSMMNTARTAWPPGVAIAQTVAPAEDAALPPAIKAIPGLEAERGLKVLDGHLTAYLRLLRRYAVDHGNDMTKLRGILRERMSQEDREEARRLAHTLKGSSGNLGATTVQQLAAELEAAIKEGRDVVEIGRLAGTTDTELQALTAALSVGLPEEAELPVASAVDWAAMRKVLAELELSLAASSVQANHLIETHAPLFKTALGPLGAELEWQIEHFLYPEALQTLRQAQQEHPELAIL